MPILAIFAPVISFLLRGVVAKFVIFSALFALVALFVPLVIEWIGPYMSPGAFTSAFSQVSPGIWFFLDFFQIGFGVPMLLTAWITRFLIRRLPVIG